MKNYKKGYAAISTVLVISAVITALIVTSSLISISEGQMSLSSEKGTIAIDFVEGCVEEGLIKINKDNAIPPSLILPEGTCTVTIDSHTGGDWVFTVKGARDGHSRTVRVNASRGSQVAITSWKEIQ